MSSKVSFVISQRLGSTRLVIAGAVAALSLVVAIGVGGLQPADSSVTEVLGVREVVQEARASSDGNVGVSVSEAICEAANGSDCVSPSLEGSSAGSWW